MVARISENLLAMDFKGRAIGLSNKNVIRDCGGEKCRDRVREGKSRAHDRRTVFVIVRVRVEKRGEQFGISTVARWRRVNYPESNAYDDLRAVIRFFRRSALILHASLQNSHARVIRRPFIGILGLDTFGKRHIVQNCEYYCRSSRSISLLSALRLRSG